jgi:hypothetical protein
MVVSIIHCILELASGSSDKETIIDWDIILILVYTWWQWTVINVNIIFWIWYCILFINNEQGIIVLCVFCFCCQGLRNFYTEISFIHEFVYHSFVSICEHSFNLKNK